MATQGRRLNGKPTVSKTVFGGSNPSAPAIYFLGNGKEFRSKRLGGRPQGFRERKQDGMAKTAVVSVQPSFIENVKGLPEKIKSFYGDVRNEMRKVTTPTRKEVEATTLVVIITVFIFGVYFWMVDGVIGRSLDWVFKYFSTH